MKTTTWRRLLVLVALAAALAFVAVSAAHRGTSMLADDGGDVQPMSTWAT